jgi:hypothetical protein
MHRKVKMSYNKKQGLALNPIRSFQKTQNLDWKDHPGALWSPERIMTTIAYDTLN